MNRLHLLPTVLLLAGTAFPAAAGTHFVNEGSSIQSAIDVAVSGDDIQIGAGLFPEDLQLRPGVSLRGAGPELTVIQGSGTESAIYVKTGATSSTTIEGLRITGGDGYQGGGIRLASSSSPTIANCVIEGNNSGNFGGGIYVGFGSNPTIRLCRVVGNTAQEGAGIYVQGSPQPGSVNIEFNVICSNSAAVTGGGLHVSGVEGITVANNTIIKNSASSTYGSGASFANSLVTLSNNIIAYNTLGHGVSSTGAWIIDTCNIFYQNSTSPYCGWDPTEGEIISEDPLFCDLDSCEPFVSYNSPAVSETCGLIGALPAVCGFTGTEATSWGDVKSMFR